MIQERDHYTIERALKGAHDSIVGLRVVPNHATLGGRAAPGTITVGQVRRRYQDALNGVSEALGGTRDMVSPQVVLDRDGGGISVRFECDGRMLIDYEDLIRALSV